jgi:3'-phosphoadenosine 5'-phosphosulfate sulfotransferase (PAPS reductase)/FAD synthetase
MGNIVAFSGGKDSTALALRLHELGESFALLFTPTGDELPDLEAHIAAMVARIGCELIVPPNRTLYDWIATYGALPNFRMRWCTRQIKIEPCIAYLVQHPGSTLLVGLRADEEARVGLYGQYAAYRYPLREWGWRLRDVRRYLAAKGVTVPRRTDCALCYGQRLPEWYQLWKQHPERYAQGEALEAQTGHTFRSGQRDQWPASLAALRAKFAAGERPRGIGDEDTGDLPFRCRVCTL